MAKRRKPTLDSDEEWDLDAECLVLEMAGQTWHIPFDTLQVIPRVGETIRLAGGNEGKVAQVEYEFAPEVAPMEVARAMPAAASYARPIRIVVRLA